MKRAYQEIGWELGPTGALQGLSLGFDRRAEHVQGITPLLAQLGVNLEQHPIGLHERKVNTARPLVRFSIYEFMPKVARRRRYPAALLVVMGQAPGESLRTLTEAEMVDRFDLDFVRPPTHRLNRPEFDLVTAWSGKGFAVHARGERNIELLEQLHGRLMAHDLAVLAPPQPGGALGTVKLLVASQMSEQDQAQLEALDIANRELSLAVFETGLLAQLSRAGAQYHALTPAWFDEAKDEVIFHLEPSQPNSHNTGWFTLAELREWAVGRGPVVRDRRLERLALYAHHGDWHSRLLQGLASIGARPRYGLQFVWLDEAELIPGVRYRATRQTEHVLPSGNYALSSLMNTYARAVAAVERRQALLGMVA